MAQDLISWEMLHLRRWHHFGPQSLRSELSDRSADSTNGQHGSNTRSTTQI